MPFISIWHLKLLKAGVSRLVWTSSTSVYDPEESGVVVEQDAQHRPSKHTGIDMLAIEQIHRNVSGDGQFVAIRLGGLFGEGAHPPGLTCMLKP